MFWVSGCDEVVYDKHEILRRDIPGAFILRNT